MCEYHIKQRTVLEQALVYPCKQLPSLSQLEAAKCWRINPLTLQAQSSSARAMDVVVVLKGYIGPASHSSIKPLTTPTLAGNQAAPVQLCALSTPSQQHTRGVRHLCQLWSLSLRAGRACAAGRCESLDAVFVSHISCLIHVPKEKVWASYAKFCVQVSLILMSSLNHPYTCSSPSP